MNKSELTNQEITGEQLIEHKSKIQYIAIGERAAAYHVYGVPLSEGTQVVVNVCRSPGELALLLRFRMKAHATALRTVDAQCGGGKQ